jgi:hypothetical protein
MPIQKRLVLLLLATLVFSISACAEAAGKFAGSWKAEHAGKTFLVLTIAAGPPLKLSISTAVIRANGDGEISEVEGPVEHEETVVEAKIDAGVLRIKAKQDDGDIVEYEMRLEGDSSALLTLLKPANIKPFRLRKT